MKILVDQNISFRLVNRVADTFPEIKQVRELGLENATDREIWEFARREGFTILTFDVDFFNYSVVWGFPPKVIWLHASNQTTAHVEFLLRKNSVAIVNFIEDADVACLEVFSKE